MHKLEPGPQGTPGSEAALESIKRTKDQLDYCFVNARMKWIFAVCPHVCITFPCRNIGSTFTSHSGNERSRLSRDISGVRNIGLGGAAAFNRAPKRSANVIYSHISGKHALWRSSVDYPMIVMQLRCENQL